MTTIEPAGSSDAERLRRLQALDELLPALTDVLDVREVFAQISDISQRVIPHDMIALPLLSEDKAAATVYAAYDAQARIPRLPQPLPLTETHKRALQDNVDHRIFDEVTPENADVVGPAARHGIRSLLRVVIRLQKEVVGVLDFGSYKPHAYTAADVMIARKIADHVAMVLSHQRLAEESRRAAALAERTANLEMLDGLLSAVTDVLDIREIFHRVSEIAGKILPHDAMGIPIITDDREHMLVHATAGYDLNDLGIIPIPESVRRLMDGDWEFDIIDDLGAEPQGLGRQRLALLGFCSALRAPIRIGGQVAALLSFFSRQPAFYKPADAVIARRIANHVALLMSHQRLAEESRRAAALQERTANLEMLDGLLSAVTDVLDIREIFDRVSEVAGKVLTHDAMGIPVVTDDREHLLIYATKGLEVSDLGIIPIHESMKPLIDGNWEYDIVDDLRVEPRGLGPQRLSLLGFRSVLRAPIRIGGQVAAFLSFFSKQESFYKPPDAVIARRIASHVAMLMSHQRLADESRRAAALKEREANLAMLDDLLKTLTDVLDIRQVFEQVSKITHKVLPHDLLSLPLLTEDRKHITVHAFGGGTMQLPEVIALREHHFELLTTSWDYVIMPDLQLDTREKGMPPYEAGYRGRLMVPIRLHGGELLGGLDAFSFQPNAYTQGDVLILRRIADHVALALSHQRLAEEAQRAAEARERASLLERRVDVLTAEVQALGGHRRVIGESKAWKDVLKQATQVAATETTVLLLGDSGTGKELVARFIHRASARSGGPFVALNCAALPEQLLESELFGYERGAFTGALNAKPGQIEQASGGVLFLDEVSEMSLSAQAKFLRVLQEKEFQRLGGTRVMKANARVIAATNRDLAAAIERGTFREDLYYRLHVFEIALPRLRDRPDDILPLSEAFLDDIARGIGRPPGGISREARRLLVDYHWPGNVRQLRNTLERAAILCEGGLITGEHLSLPGARPAPPQPVAAPATSAHPAHPAADGAGDLKSLERAAIEKALRDAKHNKSKAAKLLGLTRTQLYVRLRKYGLES